uniref:Uncharacterized protein n=1 Tax=viral metagenome TaxID=1070528 RepID=A0A6C0JQT6_9ZZZZ
MYEFVGNEEDVRKFYRLHMKEFNTTKHAAFIIIPIARRKYFPALSVSQFTINTRIFPCMDDEDRFLQDIQKYEVREGLYHDRTEGKDVPIPRDGIAIYVTANPMNEMDAFFMFQKQIMENIKTMVSHNRNNTLDNQANFKMMSVYKSCLHKSPIDKFLKLDVDTKEEEKIVSLREFLRTSCIPIHMAIESRGGYHVVIYKSVIGVKHKNLYDFCTANKSWVSIEKSPLVVIPGTYQGGFLTKFGEW